MQEIGHFAQVCRSRKSIINVLNETDHSGDEYSSEEEGADRDLQLLHVASLETNRINDNQNPGEKDEWCEFLKVGNSTLFCQLDTGAYASVINTTQLRQIAPNAPIKKTKKTLVSYSQHQIKPKGYVTLPVRFKDKELNVNFYVIDSKQKKILSDKSVKPSAWSSDCIKQMWALMSCWINTLICKMHLESCQEPTQSKLTPQQRQ